MTTPDPGDGSTPLTPERMLDARMPDAPRDLTMGGGVSLEEALQVTRTRAEQPDVVGVPLGDPLPPPVI